MGGRVQDLRAWDPTAVGDYELVGLLGVGGMGEVFLGRDGAGRLAAIKIVHDAFARERPRLLMDNTGSAIAG